MWPTPNRASLFPPPSPSLLPVEPLSEHDFPDFAFNFQEPLPTLESSPQQDHFVPSLPVNFPDEPDWFQDDLLFQRSPLPGDADLEKILNPESVEQNWADIFADSYKDEATEADMTTGALPTRPVSSFLLPDREQPSVIQPPAIQPLPSTLIPTPKFEESPYPFQIYSPDNAARTETHQPPTAAHSTSRLPSLSELIPGYEHLFVNATPTPTLPQAFQPIPSFLEALRRLPDHNSPPPQAVPLDQIITKPKSNPRKPQVQSKQQVQKSHSKDNAGIAKIQVSLLSPDERERLKKRVRDSHFQNPTLGPCALSRLHGGIHTSNIIRWIDDVDPEWNRIRQAKRAKPAKQETPSQK